MILVTNYSLEFGGNHAFVADGIFKGGIRVMCPLRGFLYWTDDYIKQLNDNYWIEEIGETSNLFNTSLIQPKD